ncbi:MAG: amidohydrolase [Clostridiaceae bacterium]|nr:amidohydrolase [Clostridiaceae bacterium]
MIAIKGGKLLTVTQGIIENGTILIEGNKIKAVGQDIAIPEGAEVICAEGKWITPGLIDVHTHISTFAEPQPRPVIHDGNEVSSPNTCQLRGLDGLNPKDIAIGIARNAGFTTCYTGPGSANVIGGTGLAFKLKEGETVYDLVIPGTEMMKMAFGENPKNVYGSRQQLPNTRMGVAAVLREALFNAKAYSDAKIAAEQDSTKKAPKPDFKLEALVPVIRREMKCRIHAHRNDDIVTAVRIAKEFNLDFVIEHCTEGYMIKDFLVKEGVTAVIGPLNMQPAKMEIWNTTFDTPGILEKAGLTFCLTQDTSSFTKMLPVNIGIAIAHGLSHEYALKAVTMNPATVLGLQDRIGSLEAGKDADIAIFNGDPFCNYTLCEKTLIDGVVYNH